MDQNVEKVSGKKRKKKVFQKKVKVPVDEIISGLQSRYNSIDSNEINSFDDFPLSEATRNGLKDSSYEIPTRIQKETIGLALQKFDILGAAKTGSGKTLAFLIPLLEILYCKKWSSYDGLGALIITPTRELALQIFETLRKIGRYHDFSAGLVIGGKDLKFEKTRMDIVNVIVCTPGRILQHMDENPLFTCDNLQLLILDEADRCLDMGFESTMNAIIDNLPKNRQTLLFSATQTRSVKDLARLSLKDPKYVSVHEHDKHKTPEGLVQNYIVCDQHEKVTVIWSFIMSHLQSKVLVFLSTCHQVRYIHEILRQLRPRTTLLALHGKIHQLKRMNVYKQFCSKKHAVLFATDIAARGLDFPEVHWVVQLDCPEDVETYIHRAGRTARYHKGGECLLVLRPSEQPIVDKLTAAKIPINQIKVNPSRMFSPQAKLEAMLANKVLYKEMAQRAFVSYVKSVFLMKDKSVFDVNSISLDEYSRSLGLAICPRVRFLQKHGKASLSSSKTNVDKSNELMDKKLVKRDSSDEEIELDTPSNNASLNESENENKKIDFGLDEEDDDIITIKRKDHELPVDLPAENELINFIKKKEKRLTAAAVAKKILKKKIQVNKKTVFDEEGEALLESRREKTSEMGKKYEHNIDEGGINIQEAKMVMKEEDKADRALFREKVKSKKLEVKLKRKQSRKIEEDEVEEDGFGSDSGSEPDLSWLPDPDKVYGKQNSDDNSENEDEEGPSKKPCIALTDESESEDNISLGDEEEFALQLLSKGQS